MTIPVAKPLARPSYNWRWTAGATTTSPRLSPGCLTAAMLCATSRRPRRSILSSAASLQAIPPRIEPRSSKRLGNHSVSAKSPSGRDQLAVGPAQHWAAVPEHGASEHGAVARQPPQTSIGQASIKAHRWLHVWAPAIIRPPIRPTAPRPRDRASVGGAEATLECVRSAVRGGGSPTPRPC